MIFARKVNKISEFHMIFLPENARILRYNCPKNIFPIFLEGGGHVPPAPISYAYASNQVPAGYQISARSGTRVKCYPVTAALFNASTKVALIGSQPDLSLKI